MERSLESEKGIKHVMVFQNISGSMIAKASANPAESSMLVQYAAVLAQICDEYIEFGTEALTDNQFKSILIQKNDQLLAVKPIWRNLHQK